MNSPEYSASTAVESNYDVAEAKELAKQDLDFFGALAVPEVMTLAFPPIMHAVWQLMCGSLEAIYGFARYAVGLPRGHAKSTVVKLLAMWAIYFSRRKFILIVGASQPLAENILADIWDILISDNMIAVFGDPRDSLEKDAANLKKFSFGGRAVILACMGANSSVRGLNIKFARPDFMIFDDAQTRECALSQSQSKEFQDRLYGTFLKLKDPRTCTYIYIGNMYRDLELEESTPERPLYCCTLRNLKDDPSWISFITGAILADGSTIWPELHSKEALLEELQVDRRAGQEATWFAEVQNDPEANTANRFDFTGIATYSDGDFDQPEGAYIIIDPSRGTAKSDTQAVTHVDIHNGRHCVRATFPVQRNPKALIETVLRYCLNNGIPLICVEDVAYQKTLEFWFNHFLEALQISGIVVQPVNPKKRAKNARILVMFKELFNGLIPVHKDAYSLIVHQAERFDPMVDTNVDDILDTVAYIMDVRVEYAALAFKPLELGFLVQQESVRDYEENNLLGAL